MVTQTLLIPLAGQLGAGSRVSSLGRLMSALSAMVTDVAEGPGSEADAAAPPPARKLSPADLATLDHCELGPNRCLCRRLTLVPVSEQCMQRHRDFCWPCCSAGLGLCVASQVV
jgi:hypothetical protein